MLAALLVFSLPLSAQAQPGGSDAGPCAERLEQALRAEGWSVRVEHEVPAHVQSIVDHVCAQRREARADVWVAFDGTRGHVEAPFVHYRQARQMVRRSLAASSPMCALGDELVRASRRHRFLRWSLLGGFLLGGFVFGLLFRHAVRRAAV